MKFFKKAKKIMGTLKELHLNKLKKNPDRSRKIKSKSFVNNLKRSINKVGVRIPILVIKNKDGNYTVIDGHTRVSASKKAGLKTILAYVVKDGCYTKHDLELMDLIGNLLRKKLKAIDTAEAIRRLINYGIKQKELAKTLGMKESSLSQWKKIGELSEQVMEKVYGCKVSPPFSILRDLTSIDSKEEQLKMLKKWEARKNRRASGSAAKSKKEKTKSDQEVQTDSKTTTPDENRGLSEDTNGADIFESIMSAFETLDNLFTEASTSSLSKTQWEKIKKRQKAFLKISNENLSKFEHSLK